jgi:hypothetical protein
MSKVKLTVSVDDAHLDRFSEVVERVKKAGLKVDQKMANLGMVTGSIDSEKVGLLRKVKGVAEIEEQRDIQIPPPESPVQ